jgi:RIO kinase 1
MVGVLQGTVPYPFSLLSSFLPFLRLKDSALTSDELFACYKSIVINTRRMYHDCNLIHGDLSEYNLLWWNSQCYIIDVSQSVEQSHPLALEFLRKDLSNITDFFGKKGLTPLLSKVTLFQFIVNKEPMNPLNNVFYENPLEMIEKVEYQEYLKKLENKLDLLLEDSAIAVSSSVNLQNFSVSDFNPLIEGGSSSSNFKNHEEMEKEAVEKAQRLEAQQEVDEAVFLQSFIPTSLNEIANPYKEIELLKGGQREKIYQDAVMNMLGSSVTNAKKCEAEENSEEEQDDESEEDEEEILQSLIAKLSKPSGSSTETGMFANASTSSSSKQEKKKKSQKESSSSKIPLEKEEVSNKPEQDTSDEREDNEEDEEEEEEDSEEEEDVDSQDEENEEDVSGSGKYRRTLPPRDLLAERLKEKEARKEAKKLTKEAKAAKRQNKIPKHVKKRAMKSGKK